MTRRVRVFTSASRFLFAVDPGLRRLANALRATLTWSVVVATLLLGTATFGVSPLYAFPGMLVVSAATMSLTMNVTDRQRFVALLLSTVSAALAITLGTLTAGNPIWESLGFLGLGFATLGAFLLGPPAVVVALAGVVAYYAVSLGNATWTSLPGNILSAAAGAMLSAILLGIVLRERPERTARRLLRSVNAAAARAAAAPPGNRMRRTDALLDAITAARTHISVYPQVWPPSLRVNGGEELADFAASVDAAKPLASVPQAWPTGVRPTSRTNVDHHDPGGRGLVPMGIQLVVASVLALIAAQLIYPQYWFWGVLAALVMLFGTTSASDAVGKGLRRVIGTAVALPFALLLAQLIDGNLVGIVVFILIAMFLQQYLADVAYGSSVFFLTLLLALLLTGTGADSTTSLEARLLLTAVGAAIGILVALLVLPTRTGRLLRDRADGALAAAEVTIIAVRDHADPPVVAESARAADRRLELLRNEAIAAQKGWPFSARHERVQQQINAGQDAMRRLTQLVDTYREDQTRSADAHAEIARILALLTTARDELKGLPRRPPPDLLDHQPPPTDKLARDLENARLAVRSLLVQLEH